MADHHQFSSSSSSSSSPDAISEWISGLPSDDLMPLSTPLLPPSLAAAFFVSPEPAKTILDAELAALETVASLRRPPAEKPLEASCNDEEVVEGSCSSRNRRRRLVWTPQLHKRFLDVMARLGSKEAVPKKIMEMMNVEELTREHVASHLQKYQMKFKESSPRN
uniref:Transcription factor n=1 Tax=Lycoris longituba TaxID=272140 RepID=D6MKE2_9ASPA